MQKSRRHRKLEILKSLSVKQARSKKLVQEQELNLIETRLLEQDLHRLKDELSLLQKERDKFLENQEKISCEEL